jgi:hypothetical protein
MIEQSESIKELAVALHGASRQITHPAKNKVNPHFKNRYADLTEVIDTIRQPLSDHGLTIVQMLSGDELVTQILHVSGQWIRSSAKMPTDKPGPQALGSALTYMRRYTLQAAAFISAEDDDDAEGAMQQKAPKVEHAPEPQSPEMKALVRKYVDLIAQATSPDELLEVGKLIGQEKLNSFSKSALQQIYMSRKAELG